MLEKNRICTFLIAKLRSYIDRDEFDTDSIQMDIEDNIGNLRNEIANDAVMAMINQFIYTNKSMSTSSVYLLQIYAR